MYDTYLKKRERCVLFRKDLNECHFSYSCVFFEKVDTVSTYKPYLFAFQSFLLKYSETDREKDGFFSSFRDKFSDILNFIFKYNKMEIIELRIVFWDNEIIVIMNHI